MNPPSNPLSSHLLLGQGRKVGGILRIRLPARGTQLVLVGSDPVPAEATDLVAARARVKVQVVHLYWLHAQRALGRLLLAIVERVHLANGSSPAPSKQHTLG